MKKITIWRKWEDQKKKFDYNHFDDEWVEGEFPLPKRQEYHNQKSWEKGEWKKNFGYLIEREVVAYHQELFGNSFEIFPEEEKKVKIELNSKKDTHVYHLKIQKIIVHYNNKSYVFEKEYLEGGNPEKSTWYYSNGNKICLLDVFLFQEFSLNRKKTFKKGKDLEKKLSQLYKVKKAM